MNKPECLQIGYDDFLRRYPESLRLGLVSAFYLPLMLLTRMAWAPLIYTARLQQAYNARGATLSLPQWLVHLPSMMLISAALGAFFLAAPALGVLGLLRDRAAE